MLESASFLPLIISLIFIVNGSIQAESANFQPIYNQDEIVRNAKSKEMLRSMNLRADPCEDFYEYSCGNFGTQQQVREHDAKVATIESILDNKISHDLQKLLEEQVKREDGTSGRRIKDFYKSCLSAEHNGQAQQAYFSEFIKANGGFPAVPGSNWNVHHHNYNWQQTIGQLRFRYGMDILIGLEVDINYQSKHENSIYLGEPKSTLIPKQLCSQDGTKRVDIRDPEYEHVEKQVSEQLMKWLTLKATDAKKLAAEIVLFEFELCTAMQDSNRNESDKFLNFHYPRRTLIEFTHQFNDSIDFDLFVSNSFNHPVFNPVFMRSEQYFQQLIKTVEKHALPTVVNYIMFRALSTLAFPPDDHPRRRPKHCVELIKRYFPKVLGDIYYRQYGSNHVRSDVEAIYEKIRKSFETSLHNNWIEESTMRLGKHKLNEIKLVFPNYDKINLNNLQIVSSDYWQNLNQVLAHVQRREFDRLYENGVPRPRLQVEAYEQRLQYQPLLQHIELPWGVLQDPLYRSIYPNSLKYALIGVKLAQELSVTFDDIGWNADSLGISNWDHYTEQRYANRSTCFRQQMSNYLCNNPEQFRNSSEVRELIAGSSGVNVAFNAYLTWLSYMSPNNDHATLVKETLPDLNLSNTQLFFVTFAQTHCRPRDAAKQRSWAPFLPMERHTVERYAVNGPLRNCIEFARDFNCLPGSEMNPTDKCVIY